jgi:hypothetical protein
MIFSWGTGDTGDKSERPGKRPPQPPLEALELARSIRYTGACSGGRMGVAQDKRHSRILPAARGDGIAMRYAYPAVADEASSEMEERVSTYG